MKTIKVQVLHSGAAVNTSVLSDSSDRVLALNGSIFFPTIQQRNEKAFTRLFTSNIDTIISAAVSSVWIHSGNATSGFNI